MNYSELFRGSLVIESDNFSLSGAGEVIAKGTLSSESGIYKTTVSAGEVDFYVDGARIGMFKGKKYYSGDTGVVLATDGESVVFSTQYDWDWGSISYLMNNGKDPENCTERNIFFGGLRVFKNSVHASGLTIDNVSDPGSGEVCIDAAVNSDGYYSCATVSEGLYAEGDIWCGGTKYRVVETENYGPIGLNAMESANAVFSDIGSGALDDTGVAYIFFDAVFAETVDLNHIYQVFLSPNQHSRIACIEKTRNYFLVQGDPGASFDWLLFARQKGYATHRLEIAKVFKDEQIKYDDSIFYGDNTAASQSISYMEGFKDTYDEQAAAYLEEYEQEVTDYDN